MSEPIWSFKCQVQRTAREAPLHPRVLLLWMNLFLCHHTYPPPVSENHVFHACMTTCNNCKVRLPEGHTAVYCTEHNINLSPEAKASQHTSGNIWTCTAAYSAHFSFTGLLLVLTSYWQRRPLFENSLSLGETWGWSIGEGVQRKKRIWKLSMCCVHRW